MSMENKLGNIQHQEQKITSSIIQGLNMLTLPSQEIYSYLVELAMANPMLNIPDPPGDVRYESVNGDEDDNSVVTPSYENYIETPSSYSGVYSDYEENDFDPYYRAGVAFDADLLAGSLKLQLSMQNLSDIENAIGLDIIGNIDDNGFFVGNLQTICLLYYQDISVGEKVLSIIQTFSPKGVGARNVFEALYLQVEPSFQYAELAKKIISENLQAVCDDSILSCSRKYGVSVDVINSVFSYIKTLEPHPGNCDNVSSNTNYIVPDIIIQNHDNELIAYIYKDTDAPLCISEEYLELLKEPELSGEDRTYLRTCLNEARSLIHSVDIRRQTFYRLAMSLISTQSDFFLYGSDNILPMTMQNLADEMGVNVSTISRLVKDKYVSTPWGIYPLKYFFSRSVKSKGGSDISTTVIKQRIASIISEENPANPYKDDDICELLANEGYKLSRRTVTKYRQSMNIPSFGARKRKE